MPRGPRNCRSTNGSKKKSGLRAGTAIARNQRSAHVVQDPLVRLRYHQLIDPNAELRNEIRRAYDEHGLGVLAVRDVPELVAKRERLLPLAAQIARQPEHQRKKWEDPKSHYNFGWSHGKEKLQDGRPDRMKGSYYNNPIYNVPTEDPELWEAYPSSARPNLWPTDAVPELEEAFMDLGQLIVRVGTLVAKHCDRYVEGAIGDHVSLPHRMEDVIRRSRCPKARLLHYFPPQEDTSTSETDGENWCGWHTDHGTLTGLVSAMYLRGDEKVASPDPSCGLHVRNRRGEVVQVSIGEDEIAYQMGEASQILSGGFLHATPHCVRAPSLSRAGGVSRNTFAVFMQPQWDTSMDPPAGYEGIAARNVPAWSLGQTFGQFTERTFQQYYQ